MKGASGRLGLIANDRYADVKANPATAFCVACPYAGWRLKIRDAILAVSSLNPRRNQSGLCNLSLPLDSAMRPVTINLLRACRPLKSATTTIDARPSCRASSFS